MVLGFDFDGGFYEDLALASGDFLDAVGLKEELCGM